MPLLYSHLQAELYKFHMKHDNNLSLSKNEHNCNFFFFFLSFLPRVLRACALQCTTDYMETVMVLSIVLGLRGIVRENEGDHLCIFKTMAGCLIWVVASGKRQWEYAVCR